MFSIQTHPKQQMEQVGNGEHIQDQQVQELKNGK
jgi:hypothetical protein